MEEDLMLIAWTMKNDCVIAYQLLCVNATLKVRNGSMISYAMYGVHNIP